MKQRYFFILLFVIGSISCSNENEFSGYVDENEALVERLNEVEGRQHTYNYDFKLLQDREYVSYYSPVSVSEGLSCIPTSMSEKLHFISQDDLPFTISQEKSNIVTSWNESNQLVFQIQFSYLENSDQYQTNFQDFFIISVTQYPDDPFEDAEATLEMEENLPSSYQKLVLVDEHPLYYKPESVTWTRMFDYYKYLDEDQLLDKESTGSSQYYAWYDGLIYSIGFTMDTDSIDQENLVREIILGN
ncbi:hypothetical protein [Labilibaculum sp.]|uniref:hypothetical protein n=1 Tax=Labilibaculum sp. TaxID=2060723 RepID=UPI003568C105